MARLERPNFVLGAGKRPTGKRTRQANAGEEKDVGYAHVHSLQTSGEGPCRPDPNDCLCRETRESQDRRHGVGKN